MSVLSHHGITNREAVLAVLESIFPDSVWDDSAEDTATRVLKSWAEFIPSNELDFKFTTFDAIANQMIVVKDIEFASICAHHLFPFAGVAHVAYIPDKLQVGLSKIPRLVQHFAGRPQVQEKLTHQVATYLQEELRPQGVAVLIDSTHTCMSCRGVKAYSASMTTSEMLGCFLDAADARSEFLSIVGGSRR